MEAIIKPIIAEINKINDTINNINDQNKQIDNFYDNKKFKFEDDNDKINEFTNTLKKQCRECGDELMKLKIKISDYGKTNQDIYKILKVKYDVVVDKYKNVLKNVIINQNKYKKIVNFGIDDLDKESSKQIYLQEQMNDGMYVAHTDVQLKYRQTQERNNEVLQLANNIAEIHDMFKDFAILVDQQHDMVSTIEMVVEEATMRTSNGNAELRKAIEYQKKNRKKMCCILLIAVIIIVVVLASVLTTIKIN